MLTCAAEVQGPALSWLTCMPPYSVLSWLGRRSRAPSGHIYRVPTMRPAKGEMQWGNKENTVPAREERREGEGHWHMLTMAVCHILCEGNVH